MDFLELAKQRYAVRKYLPNPVEDAKVQRILEAGRVAPTAANKQPQHILVLRDAQSLATLQTEATTFGAPLAILVCADRNAVWVRPFDGKNMVDTDAAIVTTHMMLEATAQGLGSCWIAYFDPASVQKTFSLPAHLEPVNLLAIGYANESPKSPQRHDTTRKPLAEMVSYENYRAFSE